MDLSIPHLLLTLVRDLCVVIVKRLLYFCGCSVEIFFTEHIELKLKQYLLECKFYISMLDYSESFALDEKINLVNLTCIDS